MAALFAGLVSPADAKSIGPGIVQRLECAPTSESTEAATPSGKSYCRTVSNGCGSPVSLSVTDTVTHVRKNSSRVEDTKIGKVCTPNANTIDYFVVYPNPREPAAKGSGNEINLTISGKSGEPENLKLTHDFKIRIADGKIYGLNDLSPEFAALEGLTLGTSTVFAPYRKKPDGTPDADNTIVDRGATVSSSMSGSQITISIKYQYESAGKEPPVSSVEETRILIVTTSSRSCSFDYNRKTARKDPDKHFTYQNFRSTRCSRS
ncbi:hypothetical protein HCU64_17555 [Methylobacterium sp. C25]|uniref:hypothetical protein n=1 Tax=Methylobacterium sp. C25 TaxID=2721622 RepID=UPI001F33252C|nr:hypothetical protein [Methylobacterium sp. C25]MCE4225562.1 hypothetical protein [Methylobacterium sp. C25]